MIRTLRGGLTYSLIQSNGNGLRLSVLQKEIHLYAPNTMRLRDADDYVAAHMDEIERERERLGGEIHVGGALRVAGVLRGVEIGRGAFDGCLEPDRILVRVPDPNDVGSVNDIICRVLSRELLRRVRINLDTYAQALGVSYGRVTVREMKRRWGSCSLKGDLRFNWRLSLAPPEVTEYVVLHELCHRVEFNHSRKFLALVERHMSDYAWRMQWLKDNGRNLTL